MTQERLLQMVVDAGSAGDLNLVREYYQMGKSELQEMPKVHDAVAIFFFQAGCYQDAYSSICLAIHENEGLLKPDVVETRYDLGLSHYYAAKICRPDWLELSHHAANSIWLLSEAESKNRVNKENWPISPFGVFLPTYRLGEVWRMNATRILLRRMKIVYSSKDTLLVSLAKFILAAYLIRRYSTPYSDPKVRVQYEALKGGGGFYDWVSSTFKSYASDASKAISELSSILDIPLENDGRVQPMFERGRTLELRVIEHLKEARSHNCNFDDI